MASEKRARITRPFPVMTTSGSSGRVLAMVMNLLSSLPSRLFHREVALVGAHGGHQQFARQRQKALLEGTAQRGRVFDQVGHLLKQGLVHAHPAAGRQGGLFDLAADGRLALVLVGHDQVIAALLQPVVAAGDRELPAAP